MDETRDIAKEKEVDLIEENVYNGGSPPCRNLFII